MMVSRAGRAPEFAAWMRAGCHAADGAGTRGPSARGRAQVRQVGEFLRRHDASAGAR